MKTVHLVKSFYIENLASEFLNFELQKTSKKADYADSSGPSKRRMHSALKDENRFSPFSFDLFRFPRGQIWKNENQNHS